MIMAASITWPKKLNLAQLPTPFYPLQRLSKTLGGPTIWLKRDDLTGAVESGNKIRKLEYIFADAIAEGCDTVISCGGTQSNHCRATAALASRLGFHCHLILREDTSSEQLSGNLLLDHLLGATVETFAKKGFGSRLASRLQEAANTYELQGRKAYIIPTGASDATGLWGYIAASKELQKDFICNDINPDYVVCATGSGGTQAGLTLGMSLLDIKTQVLGIAVCDNADYFNKKVKKDWLDWQAKYASHIKLSNVVVNTNDDYIGEGYGIADQAVFNTIKMLAQTEGVVLDPTYTGKAFYGLLQEIKAGSFKQGQDIVFIHTGGIYGLMSQASQLIPHL